LNVKSYFNLRIPQKDFGSWVWFSHSIIYCADKKFTVSSLHSKKTCSFFRSDSGPVPKKCQKCYFFKHKSWFEKRTFLSNKDHFWFQKKNKFSTITVLDLYLFFFPVFVLRVNGIFLTLKQKIKSLPIQHHEKN
jgi:hypothetical protein